MCRQTGKSSAEFFLARRVVAILVGQKGLLELSILGRALGCFEIVCCDTSLDISIALLLHLRVDIVDIAFDITAGQVSSVK